MQPFYWGSPPASRFGVYHPPLAKSRAQGIVLCHPLGHEYVRAHRAYRNLAISLSRAGFPVLRFDYLGSGDSYGDGLTAGPSQWEQDIDAAIAEMRRRASISSIGLIGLRFGATLAVLTAARLTDVATLVLWDPVLGGSDYLAEIQALQSGWIRDRLGPGTERLLDSNELLGMPAGPDAVREIRAIDLRSGTLPKARQIHIVVSTPRSDCEEWQQALAGSGVPASYHHVASAGDWQNAEAVHQLLLPHEILRQIVALMTSA